MTNLAGLFVACVLGAAEAEPIYVLDLTALNTKDLRDPRQAREVWDTLHFTASVQGLANRDAPRLFLRFMEHPDDFWLAELRRKGNWLAGRPVRRLRSVEEMIATFREYVKGLVVYTERVPAASNLASTIAGVEGRACLRFDPADGSLYGRVLATKLPPTRDELRLFDGDGGLRLPGGPPTPSTGSAKCDAYLWAQRRYLDTRRASREYLAYYLDAYWLTDPAVSAASNCTLTNHDFFIANRAVFFDLHVWPEETPVDDRAQRPGEDLRTMRAILRSMHDAAGGKVFHIGGFVPWAWKYTSHGRAGSRHGPVDSEWQYARVISAYNGVMDADALGYSGMANASFYRHFPLRDRYLQPDVPTPAELRRRGLIGPDGQVAPHAYVMFYLGDYDSAAWLNYHVPRWWQDPARGRIPCAWAFNPNLDRRAPHAMHYARTRATANDRFIAGDCGAGYLNPGMLAAPRLDSTLPAGWRAWVDHNLPYFRRYDLGITGFIIDGHAPPMGPAGLDAYLRFSPRGIVGQKIPAQGLHADTMPMVRMKADLGGTPPDAGRQVAQMVGLDEPRFLPVRTILKSPTWHSRVMDHARRAPGGERLRFLDPETFFLLLKTHERNRAARRRGRALPKIGAAVRFAAPSTAEGLAPVAAADGPFRRERVAGRAALCQKARGTRYLYFETSRRFADDLPAEAKVVLTVRVVLLDARKGELPLEYDSHDRTGPLDGAYTAARPARLEGTGTWVTATFELPHPRFAARQNAGASFRLVNRTGDLAVHSVTVTRTR